MTVLRFTTETNFPAVVADASLSNIVILALVVQMHDV